MERDDYHKLKYTEAMIKETLRMYPIVPVIARQVTTDVQLSKYQKTNIETGRITQNTE